MNSTEKNAAQVGARVIRCIRKSLGWVQTDLAEKMGVGQGTVSKLEKGILMPSVAQWFQFCEMTGASPRSYVSGVVDYLPEKQMVKDLLPEEYGTDPLFSMRMLFPLLQLAQEAGKSKALSAFLDERDIDPDLMLNLSLQVNGAFCVELLDFLKTHGLLTSNRLMQAAQLYSKEWIHGPLGLQIQNAESQMSGLRALFGRIQNYDDSCQFLLTAGEGTQLAELEVRARGGFQKLLAEQADLIERFCEYRVNALQATSQMNSRKPVQVQGLRKSQMFKEGVCHLTLKTSAN